MEGRNDDRKTARCVECSSLFTQYRPQQRFCGLSCRNKSNNRTRTQKALAYDRIIKELNARGLTDIVKEFGTEA